MKIAQTAGIIRGLGFELSDKRVRRLQEEAHGLEADIFFRPGNFIQITTG